MSARRTLVNWLPAKTYAVDELTCERLRAGYSVIELPLSVMVTDKGCVTGLEVV